MALAALLSGSIWLRYR